MFFVNDRHIAKNDLNAFVKFANDFICGAKIVRRVIVSFNKDGKSVELGDVDMMVDLSGSINSRVKNLVIKPYIAKDGKKQK